MILFNKPAAELPKQLSYLSTICGEGQDHLELQVA